MSRPSIVSGDPHIDGSLSARGEGLGLFLASRLARVHGGVLQVSSGPEKTTFALSLPRRNDV